MAFFKVLLNVLGLILISESVSIMESLNKCKIKDKECHVNNIQNILKNYGSGVPDLGIPATDPVVINNLNLSIKDVANITVIEGTVKGVRNCIVQNFEYDFEKLQNHLELTCNIVIKGKYSVQSEGELIKNLLGGSVHGDGNGKVKIDQLNVKMTFPIEVLKRDEDIFLKTSLKKLKYSMNILGKMTFSANSIYLGDKESSKDIVKVMNENWELLVKAFGTHFFDIGMKYVHDFIHGFLNNVSAKYYLLDDISSFVKHK